MNLDFAKEIIIKKNEDGTYKVSAKYDFYGSNEEVYIKEVEVIYPRTNIKIDMEVLTDISGDLFIKMEEI